MRSGPNASRCWRCCTVGVCWNRSASGLRSERGIIDAWCGPKPHAGGCDGDYTYTVPNQLTVAYTVSYLKRDGYLERSTSNGCYTPASDTSIYDALGQRIAVQQTEQLPGGTTSALARVFGYDGDNQILGRTDGTVSGTGSSATFAALAGGTTANPDAEAPPRYVKVAAMTDEYLAAEGRPAALVRRVTGAISAPHETQRLTAGGKTGFHALTAPR